MSLESKMPYLGTFQLKFEETLPYLKLALSNFSDCKVK